MTKYFALPAILFFMLFVNLASGQSDNYAKNKKTFEEEQKRFEDELKLNKDSAEVYWKHANVMAKFTFNAQKSARKFYEKSISIDSSKVAYFIDYGRYLNDMEQVQGAKALYERGLKIFPWNEQLKKGLGLANQNLLIIEENKRLASFGKAPTNQSKASDYSKITDFENLESQTKDRKSPFFYKSLLDKFNNDQELSDEQVYMLLIGFTLQKDYMPYGDISQEIFKLIDLGKFDEAIKKANNLMKTNPLVPSLYKEIIFALRKINEKALAEKYQRKLQIILNAMLYTGDGTCTRPYVTFWVNEEYTLLKYLDCKRTGSQRLTNCAGNMADALEAVNLTTNTTTEMFFNVTPVFKKMTGKK